MRSHILGLKRDLKRQNLPEPKQLEEVEQERFTRKRIGSPLARSTLMSPREGPAVMARSVSAASGLRPKSTALNLQSSMFSVTDIGSGPSVEQLNCID